MPPERFYSMPYAKPSFVTKTVLSSYGEYDNIEETLNFDFLGG